MTPRDFEIALFASTVWQVARSSDQNELLAVACSLRNNVVPRIGSVAPFASFAEACDAALKVYPLRPPPSLADPAFVAPPEGLLCVIESIYDCSMPDITATQDHPNGARYFARVTTLGLNDWFQLEIVNKQGQHPLIGTFGAMQFFA